MSAATLVLQWQSQTVETKPAWPAKLRLFTSWVLYRKHHLTPSSLSVCLKSMVKIKTRIAFVSFVETFHTSRNISVTVFSELPIQHRVQKQQLHANRDLLMFIPLAPCMIPQSRLYQLQLRRLGKGRARHAAAQSLLQPQLAS